MSMGNPNNFKVYHHVVCHVSAANLTSSFVKTKLKAGTINLCPTRLGFWLFLKNI
jgi:hypothetical protein